MFLKTLLVFILLSVFGAATPAAQNMNFDILDGEERIDVPFEYVHNFIVIEVQLFGLIPMNFIFDTGAEHIILFKREYSDVLSVDYERRIPILGSDLSRELYALVARNMPIEVSGLPPRYRDVLVLEQDYFHLDEITGQNIDGIIGGSYFKNVIVKVDYKKRRLSLFHADHFEPPGRGFEIVDINIKGNKPYLSTNGTLLDNTIVPMDLLIDTGAGLPLLLHNNSHPNLTLPDVHIMGKLGMGLGGYIEGYIGKIKHLKISGLEFNQVLTSFQDVSETILIDESRFRNGIIGNQLLSRFEMYIDYVNEKMYLKPGRRYGRKFKMDRSGLVIFAVGKNLNDYIVQDVIIGSPAEEADIREGDVIRKFQGLPSKIYSLDGMSHVLQKSEGKLIRMTIIREGEAIKKRFRLRDLL